MENKERAVEMFKMRLDGATYQEIADKYGVTKQYVHALLNTSPQSKAKNLDYVVYKGLREWMQENHISILALHKIINPASSASGRTKDKLIGKTSFKLRDIIRIVQESNLTFEQLFMQE